MLPTTSAVQATTPSLFVPELLLAMASRLTAG